jgi:hypothetical protein
LARDLYGEQVMSTLTGRSILPFTTLLVLAIGACAPDQEARSGGLTPEQDGGASGLRRKCVAGVPCSTNPGQCRLGVTSCAAGVQTCVDGVNKVDGTACNDGNACTFNDVCAAGICGGTGYTCTPNQCEASASCNGSGGCVVVIKAEGSSCSDGNPCTFNDHCTNGNCGGIPYSCAPTSCQSSAVCDGFGGCVTTPKPDGSACTDANADCCIMGGNPTCSGGVCAFPVCCNTAHCCSL